MNRHRSGRDALLQEGGVLTTSCTSRASWILKGSAKSFYCDNHEHLLPLEAGDQRPLGRRVNVSFSTVTCLEVWRRRVEMGMRWRAVAKMLG